jgi:hypothetical protein
MYSNWRSWLRNGYHSCDSIGVYTEQVIDLFLAKKENQIWLPRARGKLAKSTELFHMSAVASAASTPVPVPVPAPVPAPERKATQQKELNKGQLKEQQNDINALPEDGLAESVVKFKMENQVHSSAISSYKVQGRRGGGEWHTFDSKRQLAHYLGLAKSNTINSAMKPEVLMKGKLAGPGGRFGSHHTSMQAIYNKRTFHVCYLQIRCML